MKTNLFWLVHRATQQRNNINPKRVYKCKCDSFSMDALKGKQTLPGFGLSKNTGANFQTCPLRLHVLLIRKRISVLETWGN